MESGSWYYLTPGSGAMSAGWVKLVSVPTQVSGSVVSDLARGRGLTEWFSYATLVLRVFHVYRRGVFSWKAFVRMCTFWQLGEKSL